MLEKPSIPDEDILRAVRRGYGIPAERLAFLPLGYDATGWVYRLEAGGINYFLKLKRGAFYQPAVTVPCFLAEHGIPQVLAPLRSLRGHPWQKMDAYTLFLFPFIAGQTGMEQGLTSAQWRELGSASGQVHSYTPRSPLPPRIRCETFHPPFAPRVRQVDRLIRSGAISGPYQRELAQIWLDRRAEILRLTARAVRLGWLLRQQPPSFVLCHCDIHTANVLLDPSGGLHIVDWDNPLFAPRERDLSFHLGNLPSTWKNGPELEAFYAGYGQVQINPIALAYYRYEWVVQELGDFGARVFLRPDFGAETFADSIRGFAQLFEPGDVVAGALQSDEGLAQALSGS